MRRGLRLALVALGAGLLLAILAAGVSVVSAERREEAALAARPPARQRVVLVDLARNRSPEIAAELEVWEEAARGMGLLPERVDAAGLAQPATASRRVWVLPGQERLSDAEWARVESALAAGSGVVVTGSFGELDASGARREPPPLEWLFPGERFTRLAVRVRGLVAARRGPLVVGLDPAERLELDAPTRVLGASDGAALWSPATAEDRRGALLHGRRLRAPVVWMGVGPQRVRDRGMRLARNALRYAAGLPSLQLRAWPGGHATAALLAGDARGGLDRVERMAARMRSRGLSATIVRDAVLAGSVEPADAAAAAGAQRVARLARHHEIVAAGSPDALASPAAELESSAGHPLRGFALESGVADASLARRIADAGYLYTAVSDTGRAAPRTLELGGARLVAIPLPAADAAAEARDASAVLKQLLGAYAAIEQVGGLWALPFPEWGLVADEVSGGGVLDLLLGELLDDRVWFVRGDELARWWLARDRVVARLEESPDSPARVHVENTGPAPVRGATLRVWLPPGAGTPRARAPRSGPRARVRVASDLRWIELIVPELAAGEAVVYPLSY